MNLSLSWCIFVLILCNKVLSFEPLSIGTVLFGIGAVVYNKIRDKTYCKLKECCTQNEIPADYNKLDDLLTEKVYGQHFVQDIVVNAIKGHWENDHNQKALTLSFHGWPGSGKNYVTKFIKDSLYSKGGNSDHVHHFMGRIHFPLEERVAEYKDSLYNWIKGNVTRCARQLFIFDEVDKMPPNILNTIKPMIDYNENVEKIDYRQAIFLFLSNTGGSLIIGQYLKMWKEGKTREDIKLKDFEKLILKGAFNEEGGFHQSDTIKSNLIDHYIPFLPMQQEHVKLCILDEFKIRGISSPTEEHVEEVMEFVDWGPAPENLFSTTGCKRLSQKVAMTVHRHKLHKH